MTKPDVKTLAQNLMAAWLATIQNQSSIDWVLRRDVLGEDPPAVWVHFAEALLKARPESESKEE